MFVVRDFTVRQEVRLNIINNMSDGLSLVEAICLANKISIPGCIFVAKSDVDDEILASLKTKGTPSFKLADATLLPLIQCGYIKADVHKLLNGHCLSTVDASVRKRKVKKLGSEDRALKCEAIREYLDAYFSDFKWYNRYHLITPHIHNKLPKPESIDVAERVELFTIEAGVNGSNELSWMFLDRVSFTKDGGCRIFLKDLLAGQPLDIPRSIRVSSEFCNLGSEHYRVVRTTGRDITISINSESSPFDIDAAWPELLKEILSTLSVAAEEGGFDSLDEWTQCNTTFSKKIFWTKQQFNDIKSERAISLARKAKTKASYIQGVNTSYYRNEDLNVPDITANLILLNQYAKASTLVSARNRQALYKIKRTVLLAMHRSGDASLSRFVRRPSEPSLNTEHLKSDIEIGRIVLSHIQTSESMGKLNWIIRSSATVMLSEGLFSDWAGSDVDLKNDAITERLGSIFVAGCIESAPKYKDTALHVMRSSLGPIANFISCLDFNKISSDIATLLTSGNVGATAELSDLISTDHMSLWEFKIGEVAYHLPTTYFPMPLSSIYLNAPESIIPHKSTLGSSSVPDKELEDTSLYNVLMALHVNIEESTLTKKLKAEMKADLGI